MFFSRPGQSPPKKLHLQRAALDRVGTPPTEINGRKDDGYGQEQIKGKEYKWNASSVGFHKETFWGVGSALHTSSCNVAKIRANLH